MTPQATAPRLPPAREKIRDGDATCVRSREPKAHHSGFGADSILRSSSMNAIIYLVGLVVIVLAIISFVA